MLLYLIISLTYVGFSSTSAHFMYNEGITCASRDHLNFTAACNLSTPVKIMNLSCKPDENCGGQGGQTTYIASDGTTVVSSHPVYSSSSEDINIFSLANLFDNSLSPGSDGSCRNSDARTCYCMFDSSSDVSLKITYPSARVLEMIRVRPRSRNDTYNDFEILLNPLGSSPTSLGRIDVSSSQNLYPVGAAWEQRFAPIEITNVEMIIYKGNSPSTMDEIEFYYQEAVKYSMGVTTHFVVDTRPQLPQELGCMSLEMCNNSGMDVIQTSRCGCQAAANTKPPNGALWPVQVCEAGSYCLPSGHCSNLPFHIPQVKVINNTHLFIQSKHPNSSVAAMIAAAKNMTTHLKVSSSGVEGQIQHLEFKHCLAYEISQFSADTGNAQNNEFCERCKYAPSNSKRISIENLGVDSSVLQGQLVVRGKLTWHIHERHHSLGKPHAHIQLTCAFGRVDDTPFTVILQKNFDIQFRTDHVANFTINHDLKSDFACLPVYTVSCVAALQHSNSGVSSIDGNGCLDLDSAHRNVIEFAQMETTFDCMHTQFSFNASLENPVDPIFFEQYEKIRILYGHGSSRYKTDWQKIYNSSQLFHLMKSVARQTGDEINVTFQNSSVDKFRRLDDVYIDVVVDRSHEDINCALGVNMSNPSYSLIGPTDVEQINRNGVRNQILSTVFVSAVEQGWWGARLRNISHAYDTLNVHITTDKDALDQFSSLDDLNVWVADSWPSDRRHLRPSLAPVLHFDFEDKASWSKAFKSNHSKVPSGNGALFWPASSERLIVELPSSIGNFSSQPQQGISGGTVIAFWSWFQGDKHSVTRGEVIVELEGFNNGSFFRIGFSRFQHNAFDIHVRLSDRFQRQAESSPNIIPLDRWCHLVVRLGPGLKSKDDINVQDISLFIDGIKIPLQSRESRHMSQINFQTTNRNRGSAKSFDGISMWFSDGTRHFEPSSAFGLDLYSWRGPIVETRTFQVWEVNTDINSLVITVSTSCPSLDQQTECHVHNLEIKATTPSGFEHSISSNIGGYSQHVELECKALCLAEIMNSTSDNRLDLKLTMRPDSDSSVPVNCEIVISNGVLRLTSGSMNILWTDDAYVENVAIATSTLNSSTINDVSMVALHNNGTEILDGLNDDIFISASGPRFAQRSPHVSRETDFYSGLHKQSQFYAHLDSTESSHDAHELSICLWLKLDSINETATILSIQEEDSLVDCTEAEMGILCGSNAKYRRRSPRHIVVETVTRHRVSTTFLPKEASACPLGYQLMNIRDDDKYCRPVQMQARDLYNYDTISNVGRVLSVDACESLSLSADPSTTAVRLQYPDPSPMQRDFTFSKYGQGVNPCQDLLESAQSTCTCVKTKTAVVNQKLVYDWLCKSSHFVWIVLDDFEVHPYSMETSANESMRHCGGHSTSTRYSGSCALHMESLVLFNFTSSGRGSFVQSGGHIEMNPEYLCYAGCLHDVGSTATFTIQSTSSSIISSRSYLRQSTDILANGTSISLLDGCWFYDCQQIASSDESEPKPLQLNVSISEGDTLLLDDVLLSHEYITTFKRLCQKITGTKTAIATTPSSAFESKLTSGPIAVELVTVQEFYPEPGQLNLRGHENKYSSKTASHELQPHQWNHLCVIMSKFNSYTTWNGQKEVLADLFQPVLPFTAGQYRVLLGQSLHSRWRQLSSADDKCYGYWRTTYSPYGNERLFGGWADGSLPLCQNWQNCECQDWAYGTSRQFVPDSVQSLVGRISLTSIWHRALTLPEIRKAATSETQDILNYLLSPTFKWTQFKIENMGTSGMLPTTRPYMPLPMMRSYNVFQGKSCRAQAFTTCMMEDNNDPFAVYNDTCLAYGRSICNSDPTCEGFTVRWCPVISSITPMLTRHPVDGFGARLQSLSVDVLSVSPTKLKVEYAFIMHRSYFAQWYGVNVKCFHLTRTSPSIIHDQTYKDLVPGTLRRKEFTFATEKWIPGQDTSLRCSLQELINDADAGIISFRASARKTNIQSFSNIELPIHVVPRLSLCNAGVTTSNAIPLPGPLFGLLALKRDIPADMVKQCDDIKKVSSTGPNMSNSSFVRYLEQSTIVSAIIFQPICSAGSIPRKLDVQLMRDNTLAEALSLEVIERRCGAFLLHLDSSIYIDSVKILPLEWWESPMWEKKCTNCVFDNTSESVRALEWKTEKICVNTTVVRQRIVQLTRIETRTRNITEIRNESHVVNGTIFNESVLFNVSVFFNVSVAYNETIDFESNVCENTLNALPGTWLLTGERDISLVSCKERCLRKSWCYGFSFRAGKINFDPDGLGLIDLRTGTTHGGGICDLVPFPKVRKNGNFAGFKQVPQESEIWFHNSPIRGLAEIEILKGKPTSRYGLKASVRTNKNSQHEWGDATKGFNDFDSVFNMSSKDYGDDKEILNIKPGREGAVNSWLGIETDWSRIGSYTGFIPMRIKNATIAGWSMGMDDFRLYNFPLADHSITNLYHSYARVQWPGAPEGASQCQRVGALNKWQCPGRFAKDARVLIHSVAQRRLLSLTSVKVGTRVPRLLSGDLLITGVNLNASLLTSFAIEYEKPSLKCNTVYERRLISSRNVMRSHNLQDSFCLMRYLNGQNLDEWCLSGARSLEFDLDGDGIIDPVCSTLVFSDCKISTTSSSLIHQIKCPKFPNMPRDATPKKTWDCKYQKDKVATWVEGQVSHSTDVLYSSSNGCTPITYLEPNSKRIQWHCDEPYPDVSEFSGKTKIYLPVELIGDPWFVHEQAGSDSIEEPKPLSEFRVYDTLLQPFQATPPFPAIWGPAELQPGKCLQKKFNLLDSVFGSMQIPRSVEFRTNLWLFGQWPRKDRNYNLLVTVDNDVVWQLGGTIVCSESDMNGSWHGRVSDSRFIRTEKLSKTSCYVEITRRVATSNSFLKVSVCLTGSKQAGSLYVGISSTRVHFTNTHILRKTPYQVPTRKFVEHGFMHSVNVGASIDLEEEEYLVEVKQCQVISSQTTCEPSNSVLSTSWTVNKPIIITSLNNTLDTNTFLSTGMSILIKNNQDQGQIVRSLRIAYLQCSPNDCVPGVKIFNLHSSWYAGTLRKFTLPIYSNSHRPCKVAIRLCSKQFGCSQVVNKWNVNLKKYWEPLNNITNAMIQFGQADSDNNMSHLELNVQFTMIPPNLAFALPTERELIFWSDRSSIDMVETLSPWVGCFDLQQEMRLPGFALAFDSTLNTVASCSVFCVEKGLVYATLSGLSGCSCGQRFPWNLVKSRLTWQIQCGQPCTGENDWSPTRYCGTLTHAAMYRSHIIESQHFGLIGKRLRTLSSEDVYNDTIYVSGSNLHGYVMYSAENVQRRFGVTASRFCNSFASHLVFIIRVPSLATWSVIRCGKTPLHFSPLESDIIVAKVSPFGAEVIERSKSDDNNDADMSLLGSRFGISDPRSLLIHLRAQSPKSKFAKLNHGKCRIINGGCIVSPNKNTFYSYTDCSFTIIKSVILQVESFDLAAQEHTRYGYFAKSTLTIGSKIFSHEYLPSATIVVKKGDTISFKSPARKLASNGKFESGFQLCPETVLTASGSEFYFKAPPRLYNGRSVTPYGTTYNEKSHYSVVVLPRTDDASRLDGSTVLEDIPGAVPIQTASRLCIQRGASLGFPRICTSYTADEIAADAIRSFVPDKPSWNDVSIKAHDDHPEVTIRWQHPGIFWGRYAVGSRRIMAYEIEIKRIGHSCVAENLFGECLPGGLPSASSLNLNYCRLSRTPKGMPFSKPSYIYLDSETDECSDVQTDLCYEHMSQTNDLPMCACAGTKCSTSALAEDFTLDYEIKIADLYADTPYKFRSRAVLYASVSFEERALLAQRGPLVASEWTQWSHSVTTSSGGPPLQPPNPEILMLRITSIEFRIHRTNWNGIPISYYIFEMAEDQNCDSLNNLIWDKVEPVKVLVNNSFAPYTDFKRGDPTKGGIGAALPAGILFHYRVRAVNVVGDVSPNSNYFINKPIRTGEIEHPVAILQNASSTVVNFTTCFGIILAQPRCESISSAISAFEEVVNMKYGLVPDTYRLDNELTFGREGASLQLLTLESMVGNVTAIKNLLVQDVTSNQNTVIVDCMHHRCFKQCLRPTYKPGDKYRCFPPSKLSGITFTNALSADGSGSVLSIYPSLEYQQRREVHIDHCVFEQNRAKGNGAALYFFGINDFGGVFIRHTVFRNNVALGGSGGGFAADSSKISLSNVSFVNNLASTPLVCPPNHFGLHCLPCPYTNETNASGFCSSQGQCDDGWFGTGACICFEFKYYGIACQYLRSNEIEANSSGVPRNRSNLTNTMNMTDTTNNINLVNMSAVSNSSERAKDSIIGLLSINPFGNGGAMAFLASESSCVVTIDSLRLQNNTAERDGGAIFAEGTSIVIKSEKHSMYSLDAHGNSAQFGGTIYLRKSSFNTTKKRADSHNSVIYKISNGTALNDGGAIACIGSLLHLENTNILDNLALLRGGGIYGVLCQLELIDSEFSRNQAGFEGGFAFLESLSEIALMSSTISLNRAGSNGGAIYSKYCSVIQISKALIHKNIGAQGGGLYVEDSLKMAIIETSIISSNTAVDGGGGGILWERTPPNLIGSTVEGNKAQYGNNVASGIASLVTTLHGDVATSNFEPIEPTINVSIIDHYGNKVKRRNQATTVVATIFSNFCLYRRDDINCHKSSRHVAFNGIPACHTCPTAAQSLFGKAAQEIPGMKGEVSFVGLGARAWPGNHTLRLEITRIKPVFGRIIVSDCEPGNYLEVRDDVDGGQCILCPSGYYKTEEGIHGCKGCPAGYACQAESIVPYACPSGYITSRDMSAFCVICPLGQYQEKNTQTLCRDCLPGQYSNTTGSLVCTDCSPGRNAETSNSVECVECLPGRYADKQRNIFCRMCPAGYSSSNNTESGASTSNVLNSTRTVASFVECNPCPTGKFSSSPGSIACSICPSGKRTALPGMTECGLCPKGRAAGSELSRTCEVCQGGKYAEGEGNDECLFCPSGYSAAGEGNTRCDLCRAGLACQTGSVTPLSCPSGWYSQGDGAQECVACALGQAATAIRSTSCRICTPGTFAAVENATFCKKCRRGSFNEEQSGLRCFQCPRGYSTNLTGSPKCNPCKVRWRSSNVDFGGEGLGSYYCLPCNKGEIQPPGSGECHFCAAGFFTLQAGEQFVLQSFNKDESEHANCHPCPRGAACRGGYFLRALNGFWRSNKTRYSDDASKQVFTECFHKPACEGSAWESSNDIHLGKEHNESCAHGYTGRLCHACMPGWGRMSFDTCMECPPKATNTALTILGSLFVLTIMIGFIIYSIRSSADETSTSSMMFKTLAAYGQVIGIASLFPYKWPSAIIELFEILDMVTSVSDRVLNTDCALEERRGKGVPIVYEKAILYAATPILFTIGAICVFMTTQFFLHVSRKGFLCRWLRRRCLKEGTAWEVSDTRRCVIVSVIVAMVILHPTLTRQSLFLLMCVQVEDAYFLRKDMQLECSTVEHNLMVITVAVPSILAYVIVWPAGVFYTLKRRRHKLHLKGLAGHSSRATYGFLYRGYSAECFYWEIVIMCRKMLMIIVATFGLRATVQTQGMLALLVVAIALAAHMQYRPFEEKSLDRLELFSLITAFIVLYSGMFYFTDDVVIAPWFLYVVTAVILLVNVFFMSFFVNQFWAAAINESMMLQRCHTRCCVACMSISGDLKLRLCPKMKAAQQQKKMLRAASEFQMVRRHKVHRGSELWSVSEEDQRDRMQQRRSRIKFNKQHSSNILHMEPIRRGGEWSSRQRKLKRHTRLSQHKKRLSTRPIFGMDGGFSSLAHAVNAPSINPLFAATHNAKAKTVENSLVAKALSDEVRASSIFGEIELPSPADDEYSYLQLHNKNNDEASSNAADSRAIAAASLGRNQKLRDEASSVPKDWEVLYNNDGLPYYYNKVTKETRWNKPLPGGWEECLSKDGEKFYVGPDGKKQWEEPTLK